MAAQDVALRARNVIPLKIARSGDQPPLVVPDLIRNLGARGHANTGVTPLPARARGAIDSRPAPSLFHPFARPSQGHGNLEPLRVISSEAEKSKPTVGSRGAIHATSPVLKRCSATCKMTAEELAICTLWCEQALIREPARVR